MRQKLCKFARLLRAAAGWGEVPGAAGDATRLSVDFCTLLAQSGVWKCSPQSSQCAAPTSIGYCLKPADLGLALWGGAQPHFCNVVRTLNCGCCLSDARGRVKAEPTSYLRGRPML